MRRVLGANVLGATPRAAAGAAGAAGAAPAAAPSVSEALAALAPRAPDAQPFGVLHRTYGDANTRYLGQGASLR